MIEKKVSEMELLYRAYGCTNKKQFDEYRKQNKVMTIQELKETIKGLEEKNVFSKEELKKVVDYE